MNAKANQSAFPCPDQTIRLLALSAMCLGLLGFRIFRTDSIQFIFLAWNLFLAWVPLLIALLTYQQLLQGRLRGYHGLIGWTCWLLFFPNAPYIITDLLHLGKSKSSVLPIWYDSLMVFSYALVGLLAGLFSLHLIHLVMNRLVGVVSAWLIATASLLLAGFGIYLGRFQRWNSWDILVNPTGLLMDAFGQVTNPAAVQVTGAFTLLLLLIYLTFVSFIQLSPPHVASDPHQ